jgi:hypothetical protein
MNIALWIAQVLLAGAFLPAGFMHAFRFDSFAAQPRTAWAYAVGRRNMRIIGLLEMASAIGVVGPAATGILPLLTALAAAGLALTMLAAAIFHVRRGEPIISNVVLFALAAFIVIGRAFIEPL